MNIRQTLKLASTESYSEILKNNFFYVMFLIVQGNRTSKFFVLFSNIFIFCQYCYLNFGLKIKYIWQDYTVEILNLLLKYFTITINVKNIGFINYLYVFYGSLGVILLSIILMLLLIFVFKTQRSQQIPILILRLLLKFILTFGYWPIIRMQFGLLACQQNKAGKYVMMFETKQECWTSNYTLHAIIAIFGLTLTILFTSTIQYFAYQKRLNKFNALAMQNSNSQLTLLLYIFIQILVYQMTPTPKYTFLILLVYLIGSGFYFMMTHVQKPFYHELIQKFMSILSTVNLWVIIMMIYAYFLEGKYFNYNLTLLLIAIPLIIGVIYMKDSQKYSTILSDISSQKNGKTTINLCSYLLYLLENSEKNQRVQLILQSFIETHKEICMRNDCYAKKSAVNLVETNQKHYIIQHLINQIFIDALQNHPEDIELRLHYIFFLIDHRHQYSQALSEIFNAEQFCQSYDQQFQLYLNKKIIQQYLAEAKDTIKYDKFADVSFSKSDKEFCTLIETTTHLYIDFWTQLQEEVINISLTLQIAYKLIHQQKQIEKQYQSIMNQNRRAISIKRLYHSFQKIVANQQSKTDQLILLDEKQGDFLKEQLDDISNQSNPMAIISAHSNQEPKFINVNKSFCKFVGYTKTDLINLPLNNIIPGSYSEKHTECIVNFLNHKVTQIKAQMVKSKAVYVKQKNKYMIQSYVDVKLMEAHHNELILVAQFQPQFQIKNSCHIIISQNGNLLDITSNCIPLLGIEVDQIQQQQYNISEIFPDFFIKKNELKKKNGSIIVFQNQDVSLKKSIRSRRSTFLKKNNQKFNCQIQNIEFPCLQEEIIGPQNILVQLDLINPKHSKALDNAQFITINVKKRQKIGVFQFCVKSTKYEMNQIFVDDLEANDNQIILNQNLSRVIGIAGCIKMSKKLKTQILRIQNYGEDIRTCRLIENKIIDINDLEENDDESDLENEIDENQLQNKLQIQPSQETLNSAKLKENKILEYLQDPPIPQKLRMYVRIVSVFFLAFLVLQILSFSLTNQNESQIIDNIKIISGVNSRMSNLFMIQSILQDIRFLNQKYYYENNITKAFSQQLSLLDSEIKQIQKIHNSLSQLQIKSSQQYQQWTDSYYSRNIQMMDYLGNFQSYTFKEAIDQLISKAIILNNSEIENFDYHKADYFYYIYNSFNTIVWNGRLAEMYYESLILTILDQTQNLNTLLFVLNTIFIPCLSLIIILFLMQIHQDIDEIIKLLVDFEENSLQKLQQQCESFLNIVFFDDCDDIKSQEPDEKVQTLQYNNVISKKRRKINIKNSIFSQKKIIIEIGIICILIQFYFTYCFIDSKTVLDNYYELLPILNQTSIIENYYRLQDNIIREVAINPNITILNTPNKTAFIFEFFDTLYEVNANLFELINQHTQYLSSTFQQQFDQIYLFNPCILIDVNKTECGNFSNGILLLGQSAANIKYIEDLRIMNYEFLSYAKNQVQIQSYDIESAINKLLNSDRAKDVRKMQQIYLRKQQIYLIQALESSITESFNMLKLRKGIFLGFLILILIFIFSLWIPLQQQQVQQLRRTKKILQLFPFEVLIKSNLAVNYFKGLRIW